MNRVYHWVRRVMLARKARLVKHNSRLSQGSLLDIGTGTGYFPHFMQERGWHVSAIEKSPQARQFAKEHFELDVAAPEALNEFADKSFDVITLWHVMEHLEHLNETWETLKRILKDQGILIIAVPNPTSFDAEKYKEMWGCLRCSPTLVAFQSLRHAAVWSQTRLYSLRTASDAFLMRFTYLC